MRDSRSNGWEVDIRLLRAGWGSVRTGASSVALASDIIP
jgi:hypothetical protein